MLETKVNDFIGCKFYCFYPNKNTGILERRSGVICGTGKSKNGLYVKCEQSDGTFRTFLLNKAVLVRFIS